MRTPILHCEQLLEIMIFGMDVAFEVAGDAESSGREVEGSRVGVEGRCRR